VLDLTRVIAGPVATRYLAALGADVLRVDPPHLPELGLHVLDGVPGKRSTLLDLRPPESQARLQELLDDADVLVHGYRPGALAAFGLDVDTLATRHPGLVVVGLSAWGTRGPWGGRRGFDSIVQAACGIALLESPDGERPGALPCQLLDHATGYLAAAAALTGLSLRATAGGTQAFELSLARTAAWVLAHAGPSAARGPADGPPSEPEAAWLTTQPSDEGPLTLLTPPGRLDGQPLGWPSGPVRYGQDPPHFPSPTSYFPPPTSRT
jgi:crotonobetainyl-CoA:carnitine CoA-transferase CaiB-like acyl-CoA transferase